MDSALECGVSRAASLRSTLAGRQSDFIASVEAGAHKAA